MNSLSLNPDIYESQSQPYHFITGNSSKLKNGVNFTQNAGTLKLRPS